MQWRTSGDEMLTRDDLHDYQQEAVEWLTQRKNGFLWLGTGDGKTVIGASSITSGARVLIVGTKRIVENVWPTELKKWSHLCSLSYSSATGPKKKREAAVASSPDILGVSYENLKWLIEEGHTDDRCFWIFDEVCHMKDPSTKRFKALQKHFKVNPPDKVFGMTATPSTEGHLTLYAQWRSVLGDARLGRNLTEFRHLFATAHFRGSFTDYTITEPAKEKIETLLRPDVFTIDPSKRPYQGKPLIIDVPIPWGTTGARDHYLRMEKELVADLGTMKFAAASKGVAFNKCRQIAAGFIYDEDSIAHGIDTLKFDAVEEAYAELQGDPVLIFYQFQHEKDELLRRLPGVQPLGDNYDAFSAGDIPGLVLHPISCAHGLNLQNARYVFWSSLPWSGRQYGQANARVDRQGQTRQPVIKRFTRTGTIDEHVVDVLEGKLTGDAELIARIREGHSAI